MVDLIFLFVCCSTDQDSIAVILDTLEVRKVTNQILASALVDLILLFVCCATDQASIAIALGILEVRKVANQILASALVDLIFLFVCHATDQSLAYLFHILNHGDKTVRQSVSAHERTF